MGKNIETPTKPLFAPELTWEQESDVLMQVVLGSRHDVVEKKTGIDPQLLRRLLEQEDVCKYVRTLRKILYYFMEEKGIESKKWGRDGLKR